MISEEYSALTLSDLGGGGGGGGDRADPSKVFPSITFDRDNI